MRELACHGELINTHMPKKLWVKNRLHECQLLVSVTLPLGGTVSHLGYDATSKSLPQGMF